MTWASIRSAAHAADRALRGPAARAISDFVGVEHEARDNVALGGAMLAKGIEDAFSPAPSAAGKTVRDHLTAAFAPVRALLPETVTLYRAQSPVGPRDSKTVNVTVNAGSRSVLSWTFSRAVANHFADGGKRRYETYTDDALRDLIAEFHRAGRVRYHNYILERGPDPEYADILDGDGNHITDTEITEGIWPFMAEGEADRRADNAKIDALRQRVLVRQVPREAIVWITDRAGQQEAIVLNTHGRPWYVNERGVAIAAGLFNFVTNVKAGSSMSVSESLRRFCVTALPADDIKRQRNATILWHQIVAEVKRTLGNAEKRKDVISGEMVSVKAGSYQRLRDPSSTYPHYKRQGADVFLYDMDRLLPKDHPWARLRVCINLVPMKWDKSGVFYTSGYGGEPTVIVNVGLSEYQDNGLRINNAVIRDLGAVLEKDRGYQSTFVHEFGHYMDSLTFKARGTDQGKIKYSAPAADDEAISDTERSKKFKAYINDRQEINSLYLEWVAKILDHCNRLIVVKRDGVRARWPSFQEFWTYFWEPMFAPQLVRNATPERKRRLQRRLSKFYEFICQSGTVVPVDPAKKFAARQLNAEIEHRTVESALAHYCTLAFYDHRSDMGTPMGGDSPIVRIPAPPPTPKPAPAPAPALAPKKGPPVAPHPGKGKAAPLHKGKAPKSAEDEAPPEDEAEGKGGKEKTAPKPHKGPAPKLKPLRV